MARAMMATDEQWSRYVDAYDANEAAGQGFSDRIRSICLGQPFDAAEVEREAVEMQRLFAVMMQAVVPITRAAR
jgi:hypothetical protein